MTAHAIELLQRLTAIPIKTPSQKLQRLSPKRTARTSDLSTLIMLALSLTSAVDSSLSKSSGSKSSRKKHRRKQQKDDS